MSGSNLYKWMSYFWLLFQLWRLVTCPTCNIISNGFLLCIPRKLYVHDFSWAECIGFMTNHESKSNFGKWMRFVDVYIRFWKFQEVQQSCKMFTIYSLYVHCMFYVNAIKLHWQSFVSLLASRLSEERPSVSRVWLFYLHSKNRPVLAILFPNPAKHQTKSRLTRPVRHPYKQKIGCRGFSRKTWTSVWGGSTSPM